MLFHHSTSSMLCFGLSPFIQISQTMAWMPQPKCSVQLRNWPLQLIAVDSAAGRAALRRDTAAHPTDPRNRCWTTAPPPSASTGQTWSLLAAFPQSIADLQMSCGMMPRSHSICSSTLSTEHQQQHQQMAISLPMKAKSSFSLVLASSTSFCVI